MASVCSAVRMLPVVHVFDPGSNARAWDEAAAAAGSLPAYLHCSVHMYVAPALVQKVPVQLQLQQQLR